MLLIASLFPACACRHSSTNTPSAPAHSHYVRRTNADTVVVFVHGIFGDANTTWTNSETHAYWPELLTKDAAFSGADLYVYAFSSPYFDSASTLDELVEQMNLVFASDEVFAKHKQVVFLCHSMGGLLTRKLLTRYQPLAAQVSLIYFFSTPTTGADVTRLALVFSANPQITAMLPGAADRYVDILQRDWRAAGFRTVSRCAYEEEKTKGVRIVDPSSASMLCDGSVLPIQKDHIGIVKPEDAEALSYTTFKQAFLQVESAGSVAASGKGVPASNPAERTAVALTTRPVTVPCGQTTDKTLSVPLPVSLQPGGRLVDAIVSLQQGANLKAYNVELAGRSDSSVDIRYMLTGLDSGDHGCVSDGTGSIVVAFVLAQPVLFSSAPGTQIRQTTKGDRSPAIYGVTGNVTIIRNVGPGMPPPSQAPPPSINPLPLATVPALQGMLLDQKTRGTFSPAIAAVGGSVFIYDSSTGDSKKKK